jgi:hypothetical protein
MAERITSTTLTIDMNVDPRKSESRAALYVFINDSPLLPFAPPSNSESSEHRHNKLSSSRKPAQGPVLGGINCRNQAITLIDPMTSAVGILQRQSESPVQN